MMSNGQRNVFFKLVGRAYSAHVARLPIDQNKPTREQFWRSELLISAGVESLHELGRNKWPAKAFDRAMLHFATIAQDAYWLNRLSDNDARKTRNRLKTELERVSKLKNERLDWDYARAIYERQSGPIPADLSDCPKATLRKVLQALIIYGNRLAARAKADAPLPF